MIWAHLAGMGLDFLRGCLLSLLGFGCRGAGCARLAGGHLASGSARDPTPSGHWGNHPGRRLGGELWEDGESAGILFGAGSVGVPPGWPGPDEDPGMRAHLSTFFRSFLIQGSWNNRTMIGGGSPSPFFLFFAGSYREDRKGSRRRFSGTPNISTPIHTWRTWPWGQSAGWRRRAGIRRRSGVSRLAVRGPLGGMGDALIWVGWRPATVLAALVLALAGAPPWVTVVFFLVVYNLGHLALRAWGFRVGLERGSQVGTPSGPRRFSRQADRLAAWACSSWEGWSGWPWAGVGP